MNDADQQQIDGFFLRIMSAWRSGDAVAYANEFTPEATYVTWLGDVLTGRMEIERLHAEVFAHGQKGERMAIRRVGLQSLGRGVVSVLTNGGLSGDEPVHCDKLQTFTLIRTNDRWQCIAFHNTKMSERAEHLFSAR